MEADTHNLFEHLCQVLPDRVVRAAELCSVPHGLEDELGERMISDLLGLNGHSRSTWVEVKMLPFVYPYEGSQWRFSDPARAYFSGRLEQRNGTVFEVHRYLTDNYQEEYEAHENKSAPQARELAWRAVYHLAPNAPEEAVERLSVLGEQAAESSRLADMQGVIDLFDEQERWLSDFRVERAYFEGRYAYAKRNYQTAEPHFSLVWREGRPNLMKAIAGHLLGQIVGRKRSRRSLEEAEGLYRESLRIGEELGLQRHLAMVLNSLGRVLDKRGGRADLDEAEGLYRESLRILREMGDRRGVAMVLNSLGRVLDKRGGRADLDEAEGLYRESLEIERESGNRRGEAMVLNSLGLVLVKRGGQANLDEAEVFYQESLRIGETLGLKRHVAMISGSLGKLAETKGDFESAIRHFERLIAVNESLENKKFVDQGKSNINRLKSRMN